MKKNEQITKVGVGVMIWKDGKVLLGKRLASHGVGTYAFPGGHIEYLESFEDAVRREVIEETGLLIEHIRFAHVANIDYFAPKHYINICFFADWKAGEPRVMEPEKCEGWDWYDIDHLPEPLFLQSALLVYSHKKKKNFYDQKDIEDLSL